MIEVDALVVGAGPAGAVAALNLAPTRRVLLIDRNTNVVPRIGESLPPAARRLLSDMGLWSDFLNQGHDPCYGNRSVWGLPDALETDWLRDPDGHGWHLNRARFEEWLRRHAEYRGAPLLSPARVESTDREGANWKILLSTSAGPLQVKANVIVDACGRVAPVAKKLGARRRRTDKLVCGWLYGRTDNGGAGAGLTHIEATERGWWYSAPLPDRWRVLAFHTDADLPEARHLRDSRWLLDQASRLGELADVILESGFVADGRAGFNAAHSALLEPYCGPGWFAVGDAALSFDPISSQGLLNALYTGLLAAEAADRLIDGDISGLDDYRTALDLVARSYRHHLAYWYGLETRWRDAPFWRRRAALSPGM